MVEQHQLIMGAILSLLLIIFRLTCAVIVIPAPNGTYGVRTHELALTDISRLDPFATTPENRSVVVSTFYPTALRGDCEWELVPYMPTKTAAIIDQEFSQYGVQNGTFESFRLQLCLRHQSEIHQQVETLGSGLDKPKWPIVLFSPGLGNSRLLYSAMAQAVASRGYTVITIDHPYDAEVVEFPDGRVVLSAITNVTEALIMLAFETRVKDVTFVLKEVRTPGILQRLIPQTEPAHWTNIINARIAMYGHSLGGATAAQAMLVDESIIGGVDLDGELFGPVIHKGLENPFVLFGHDTNNTSPTWSEVWPHLHWKLQLLLKHSGHATFTDLPLLAQLLGYDPLPPRLAPLLGTIPGDKALDVISAYVVALLDLVLKCKPQSLLQKPSEMFPDVCFVRD